MHFHVRRVPGQDLPSPDITDIGKKGQKLVTSNNIAGDETEEESRTWRNRQLTGV